MDATLTWLDLTASDRDRMRQVLDLFKEQGTVDEMGLGSLRDALSEALFPGTSTIQTRLRYVLFVPWIYRQLDSKENRRLQRPDTIAEGRARSYRAASRERQVSGRNWRTRAWIAGPAAQLGLLDRARTLGSVSVSAAPGLVPHPLHRTLARPQR